jgi:allantoinase
MCEAPAALAGLSHKGAIATGHDADLVVFDPGADWVVDASALAHRHPVTPYHGARLTGRPLATYLRGTLIASDGRVQGDPTGAVLLRPGLKT